MRAHQRSGNEWGEEHAKMLNDRGGNLTLLLRELIVDHLEWEGLQLAKDVVAEEFRMHPPRQQERERHGTKSDTLARKASAHLGVTVPVSSGATSTLMALLKTIGGPQRAMENKVAHQRDGTLRTSEQSPPPNPQPATAKRAHFAQQLTVVSAVKAVPEAFSPSSRGIAKTSPVAFSTPPAPDGSSSNRSGSVRRTAPALEPRERQWSHAEGDDEISGLRSEGNVRGANVVGGTGVAIVHWIMSECEKLEAKNDLPAEAASAAKYNVDVFFCSFTDCMDPSDVVNHLKSILAGNPHCAWAIQQFVLQWLGFYFDQLPLRSRRALVPRLVALIFSTVEQTHHVHSRTGNEQIVASIPPDLARALEKAELALISDGSGGGGGSGSSSPASSRPVSPLRKIRQRAQFAVSPSESGARIFELDPVVVAAQLTLIDAIMFRSIPGLEFLNKAWERKRYERVAAHTRSWQDRFNALIEWFPTLVLHAPTPEERAARLIFLIDLGCALRDTFNNFMSTAVANYALTHLALKKLQDSWALVPSSKMKKLKKLEKLYSHKGNYSKYRAALREAGAESCIPCMVVHHKDLFDEYDNQPHRCCPGCASLNSKDAKTCHKCGDAVDKGYHAVTRLRSLAATILTLQHFQRTNTYEDDIEIDLPICNLIERGLRPHLLYFETHKRSASKRMFELGRILEPENAAAKEEAEMERQMAEADEQKRKRRGLLKNLAKSTTALLKLRGNGSPRQGL
eukprot:g976.t1